MLGGQSPRARSRRYAIWRATRLGLAGLVVALIVAGCSGSGSFIPTGSMITAHSGRTATALSDGHALIAGGLQDFYALRAIPVPGPSTLGTTASASESPVLIGAGDICVTPSIADAGATAALISARPNDSVFTIGDNSNEGGTADQYANCYGTTWGAFLDRTHATVGNHDYLSWGAGPPCNYAYWAGPYYCYFGAAAGPPGKGYYSYNLANNWHVIVLNGMCSEVGGCGVGSVQETFLETDLAVNAGKHIIAMWHQPLFSSGVIGNNPDYTAWWQDLYAAHADIVLNGHDHEYERFDLQSPTGQADPDGIREFIVGTGGATPSGLGTLRANSQVRNSGTFGVLELTLGAHDYSWQFIPVAGQTFSDSGTQATHSDPIVASTLVVSGIPSPTAAGVAGNVTVTAEDPSGNTSTGYRGTIHFASFDPAAVLPADYTFTTSDPGVHTFSVTLKTAGTQSVTATDTVTGTIEGAQAGIVVTPVAASTLAVSGIPSPTAAGVAGNVTVTAEDPYGNTATGYLGTVQFASSDPAAVLPAGYTFTAADNGVHTFSVTLKTAGTQSVTATDTVTGTIEGVQAGIVVTPAAASTLVVSGFASPTVAGVAGNVTVTAEDPSGNTATGYLGTVQFASSDPQAKLPANYTFTAADAGTHVFSVILKTAGTQSVIATDTVTGTITGVQSGIAVNAAALSKLVVSGLSSSRTAGVAGSIRVTATDAYGNRIYAYLGTVQFSSTDAKAGLPANYTFTAADAGTHVFSGNVILKTAGTQSVTATDTATSSVKGSQAGIVVNAAALSKLVVSGLSSPRTAGSWGSIRVTATDAYGNRIHGYLGTIHFTSSDPQAKLPANYTFTAADAGTHVFSGTVILKTAGTQSVSATDTKTATIKGAQAGIVVNAAALSKLVVSGLTTPRTAGSWGSIRVTATDAYGNRIHGYLGTVQFTSSDAKAKLPANYKFTAADAGTHVFSVILKTRGTQSVRATDTVTGTITGVQSGIVVK
jgi:hypothetical protein